MAIYDFFLSRNGAPVTAETYVGHTGRLFYDSTTGEIRISDGTTAGGNPIPITLATATTAGSILPGPGFAVTAGVLSLNAGPSFFLDENDVFRLRPGSADLIGGIKAGPGIVIDSEGTLFIDSEGLEFSFGDFTATVGTYTDSTEYALLSSIKADEDIVIASNGSGGVKVVGKFEIFATNGSVTGSLEDEPPFFRVLDDGQVRILVPLADTEEGGVEIIGSESGASLTPGIAGTMLHLTGNANTSTRVYHDTLGDYSSYVFRRYNGSVSSPGQVLAGEDIGRINWTAATNAGMGNVSTAQIRITSLENQTTTAQGSKITFTVTPVGQPATNRVDVVDITAANGVSATKFTGPLTGNVTGNADTATTATNLAAATGILAGSVSINPTIINRSTASVQTFTLTGLTTNHKIVITSGTAFGYGVFITAAWASATNTLSVEIQNILGNTDVDLPAKSIQYFAWI
jgi:hypothetical protein